MLSGETVARAGKTVPRAGSKYRPIATLGEGGMARVLLTVTNGPAGVHKLLVIKQIRRELAQDAGFVRMFLDEARLAARLSHPNVIHTYEVGIDDDGPFIVMEYLDGQSLQALISHVKRANMPLAVHLRILTKVLAGLHYAHELKDYNDAPLTIVHRDVSPQNVFICYDGHVKVVDFGVAKMAGRAERTAAGTFKGKIGYIAPEQLSGGEVDRRADVFSVGVMLWEALAHRRMTANENAATTVHKRLHGLQPSIGELHLGVDDKLAAICDKATAFSPDERFATAADMHEALEAYLDASGLRADERDIGALVCEAFAADRLRIRATIEEQIGRASQGRTRFELPNLETGYSFSSDDPPSSRASSGPATVTIRPPSIRSASRDRRLAIGASLVAVGLVGFAIVKWAARPEVPPSRTHAAVAISAAKGAPAQAAPPMKTTISLAINVTPPKATVSLDGAPLAANPFRGEVSRDSNVHRLTVSAPGYVTEERNLSLERDAIVDLMLKRAAPPPAMPPLLRAMPANAAAAPAPGSDLKRLPRAKTSIDEEDPYK
jgi:serine/threonine-protein kinase